MQIKVSSAVAFDFNQLIYAVCSVPRPADFDPRHALWKKTFPVQLSIPVGYPSDQRCQQLTKPQNFTIFHAITDENVIKFNFDIGDAVHSGFTYRTFWEAMLPSLGIAWILCTNYDIQGRNLTMNKPLEKVLGFYSSPSTNLVPVRRLAAW